MSASFVADDPTHTLRFELKSKALFGILFPTGAVVELRVRQAGSAGPVKMPGLRSVWPSHPLFEEPQKREQNERFQILY